MGIGFVILLFSSSLKTSNCVFFRPIIVFRASLVHSNWEFKHFSAY